MFCLWQRVRCYGSSIAASTSNSGKVIIKGGTFKISGFNGMHGMEFYQVKEMYIFGGTFNIDPTNSGYVAEGCTVVKNSDNTYTVISNA